MTFFLGLTGSIATGKSTASRFFQMHNIPVIDADLVAREVVIPGTDGLQAIVNFFGPDILLPNGELNREQLGDIIFSDKEKKEQLNELLSQFIYKKMIEQMTELANKNEPLVVVDIPLLYEGSYDKMVDAVMVIYTSKETQLERLMQRNNLSQVDALNRIHSQWSIDKKVELADYVIDNNDTLAATNLQLLGWLEKFKETLI